MELSKSEKIDIIITLFKLIIYIMVGPLIIIGTMYLLLLYFGQSAILGDNMRFTYEENKIEGLPLNFNVSFTKPQLIENDKTLWQGDKFQIYWEMLNPLAFNINFDGQHQVNAMAMAGIQDDIRVNRLFMNFQIKNLRHIRANVAADKLNTSIQTTAIGIGDSVSAKDLVFSYDFSPTSPKFDDNYNGVLEFSANELSLPRAIKFPLTNPINHLNFIIDGTDTAKEYFTVRDLNLKWRDFEYEGKGKLQRFLAKGNFQTLGRMTRSDLILPQLFQSQIISSRGMRQLKSFISIARHVQDKPMLEDPIFVSLRYNDGNVYLSNKLPMKFKNNPIRNLPEQPQDREKSVPTDPMDIFNGLIGSGAQLLRGAKPKEAQ